MTENLSILPWCRCNKPCAVPTHKLPSLLRNRQVGLNCPAIPGSAVAPNFPAHKLFQPFASNP